MLAARAATYPSGNYFFVPLPVIPPLGYTLQRLARTRRFPVQFGEISMICRTSRSVSSWRWQRSPV